jgi:2-polyprenyl-3-methyl-5-hydroxy-6-metoxy-1,4-benzoquinol methylase
VFNTRATEAEFLDLPDCSPVLAAASYRFMETVNHHFGGIRIVRNYLAAEAAGNFNGGPLRILDIGSGSCDIPLAVARWAHAAGIHVQITGLEIAGNAVDIALGRLAQAGQPPVQILHEDIFSHQPTEPYDCAVASMCFHHFSNAEIITLVKRLQGFVRNSLLINDLRRCLLSSLAARLLLSNTRALAGVRHDALLSIRRGFKIQELKALLQPLDNVSVSVEPAPWFRVAAVIRF